MLQKFAVPPQNAVQENVCGICKLFHFCNDDTMYDVMDLMWCDWIHRLTVKYYINDAASCCCYLQYLYFVLLQHLFYFIFHVWMALDRLVDIVWLWTFNIVYGAFLPFVKMYCVYVN